MIKENLEKMSKDWITLTSLLLVSIYRIRTSIADVVVTPHDRLTVAFQWKQMDYEWPTVDVQKTSFPNYLREDNLPLGLEVAGNRIFITVPRWKKGVAASLNYININGTYVTS